METKTDTINRLLSSYANDDEVRCPSCDAKLKRYEVPQHCEQEIELFKQTQTNSNIINIEKDANGDNSEIEERRKPWKIFQKVQRNRQSRLRQRTRKRPAPESNSDQMCPMCNALFSKAEIQRHVEQCLRRSNATTNDREDNSSNDEDDDGEEYEEYEWAGQKRIRASSLLQGGYAALGIGQTIGRNNVQQDEDEDEDLNVDEDDTQIYGPPQYGEGDVISTPTDANESSADGDVTIYMRQLITGSLNQSNPLELNSPNQVETIQDNTTNSEFSIPKIETPKAAPFGVTVGKVGKPHATVKHQQQVIESLKTKLRYYENHVQNKFKCLICLDDYRKPAISVACWHVHCEECWLRSLGARKLCPQCNLITTPKDLRRIYL